MKNSENLIPDEDYFIKMLTTQMPYGKHKGMRLIDLPEDYVMWFSRKGFPDGSLGDMLKNIYEIQLNGLDDILKLRTIRR